MLPKFEKKDHMYSHDLQSQENKVPHNDEFRITESQIDKQKKIEKLIKRENEERRQQQNLLKHKRRRNESQTGNNRNNRSINNHVNNMSNFFDNNNNSNRINLIRGGGIRLIKFDTRGPNGPMIVQQLNSNESRNIISHFNFPGTFINGYTLDELIRMSRIRENLTNQENLIELQETKINDVKRLDPDKKKCVICLEDFKKGDKTIALPCIHLFHTICIRNWLKTKNSCPLCKFKLSGENINSQS
jgi:hypothetical protein